MHEYSLVRALLRQLKDLADQYPEQRLTSVRVQIGEFSGVEPELLSSAFSELSTEASFSGVVLVVERTQLRAACTGCTNEFRIQDFSFVCPDCGSSKLQVLGGEELMLDSITMEDNAP